MNCVCRLRDRAKHKWGRIHLVDKCLLIILFFLMLQSALGLFLAEQSTQERNSIDVVVRTSAAGIFGYLVSANFDQQRKRSNHGQPAPPPTMTAPVGETRPRAKIGFDTGSGEEALAAPEPPKLPQTAAQDHKNYDRAQIIIVAAVGIASLVILLVYRNFWPENAGSIGSLTQFRDFVSGSVGFLISCSTSGTGEGKD